jgi:TRAP-type uncharacterized transport system fused permease subunit
MLLVGATGEIIQTTVTAILGSVLLACSLGGHLYFLGKMNSYLKILSFICGFCLLYPRWEADIAGLVLLSAIFIIKFFVRKPHIHAI